LTEHPGASDLLVSKSSYFLRDPPSNLRFLASLGVLSLIEFDHCSVVDLFNQLDRSEGHHLVCLSIPACALQLFSSAPVWPHPKDLLVDNAALPVTYEDPRCPNKN
jgi:hypothetical protein